MPQIVEPMDLLMAINERRLELGLSERDLCRRAGLSHGSYWHTLNKSSQVSLRAALAYCNVLGLTLKVAKGRGNG